MDRARFHRWLQSFLAVTSLLATLVAPARAVDGVIEINQASLSGTTVVWLHRISSPGSYRLTGDLIAPVDSGGIQISASDVTLDLNGFRILGSGGAGFRDGIGLSVVKNVEIRNGTIEGFSRHGIFAVSSTLVRVVDVRSLRNVAGGIRLEGTVAGGANGGFLVRGCTALENGHAGITLVGDGGLVLDNVIRGNTGLGLEMVPAVGYGGNILSGNNSGGTQVGGGSAIACNLIGFTAVCPP